MIQQNTTTEKQKVKKAFCDGCKKEIKRGDDFGFSFILDKEGLHKKVLLCYTCDTEGIPQENN